MVRKPHLNASIYRNDLIHTILFEDDRIFEKHL